MNRKICPKCKKEKKISEFHVNTREKDGLQWSCKECRSIKSDEKKQKEKQIRELKDRGLKQCNKCGEVKEFKFFKKDGSGYRTKCKLCCRDEIMKYGKSDSYRNYQREYQREWREEHREKVNERAKLSARRPIYREKLQIRNNEINHRLVNNLRHRVNRVIKDANVVKGYKTMDMLGCTIIFFKEYISSLFTDGMSWDNYGKGKGHWSIDHIIPCASFIMTDPEEQKRCFHYTNMQPMWGKMNLLKSSWHNGIRHKYKKNK